MPIPKSVTKIKKDGLEFISSVDRVNYTIRELVRAAQRDTAKLIRKRLIEEFQTLPGMRRNRRIYRGVQYWVRKRELDLQIGLAHDTWYSARSELGTFNQPRRGILRDTVYKHISDIRNIQAQYLSAVEQEQEALALVNEDEARSGEGPEE